MVGKVKSCSSVESEQVTLGAKGTERPRREGSSKTFAGRAPKAFLSYFNEDLARLLHVHGKRDEARALLAPVYGRFTEGFELLDLREAKAMLDQLDKAPSSLSVCR